MSNEIEQQDDKMYEYHRFVVDPKQEPLRVDKFLMLRVEKISRNKIQNSAKAGSIKVNDKVVKSNYKVKPNDVVTVVMAEAPRNLEIKGEDIPLDIVYEDEDVIVVNKKPGMVVHPGHGNYTGTLVNALIFHLENLPIGKGIEANQRPGLVHRIDKNTSGLLVMAKNDYTLTHLAKQFFDHTVERRYHALVWGDVKEDEGTITGHIGRDPRDRKTYTVYPDGDVGKHAVTHYKVLERFGYVTLVECKLETGRTHQIRVHMRYLGHPLFQDEMYGGDKIVKGSTQAKYIQFIRNCFGICERQALHAKTLGFQHPTKDEMIRLNSDLPEDIQTVIDRFRRYIEPLKARM